MVSPTKTQEMLPMPHTEEKREAATSRENRNRLEKLSLTERQLLRFLLSRLSQKAVVNGETGNLDVQEECWTASCAIAMLAQLLNAIRLSPRHQVTGKNSITKTLNISKATFYNRLRALKITSEQLTANYELIDLLRVSAVSATVREVLDNDDEEFMSEVAFSELSEGDHLIARNEEGVKHGIYCGDNTIIEFANDEGGCKVTRQEIDSFRRRRELQVCKYYGPHSPREVLFRAIQLQDQDVSELLLDSSEKFVEWCISASRLMQDPKFSDKSKKIRPTYYKVVCDS